MAVKPIPEGYQRVIPYLVVPDVGKLIEFLKEVFDGEERERTERPDGSIQHAEVRIGDSTIMMGEPTGTSQPIPASLYVYVADTDTAYKKALQAGATSLMEPANQFYGDRNAGVKDASGNTWWIGTHVEDVPPEELARRARERG